MTMFKKPRKCISTFALLFVSYAYYIKTAQTFFVRCKILTDKSWFIGDVGLLRVSNNRFCLVILIKFHKIKWQEELSFGCNIYKAVLFMLFTRLTLFSELISKLSFPFLGVDDKSLSLCFCFCFCLCCMRVCVCMYLLNKSEIFGFYVCLCFCAKKEIAFQIVVSFFLKKKKKHMKNGVDIEVWAMEFWFDSDDGINRCNRFQFGNIKSANVSLQAKICVDSSGYVVLLSKIDCMYSSPASSYHIFFRWFFVGPTDFFCVWKRGATIIVNHCKR